jgi:hypothetical protein
LVEKVTAPTPEGSEAVPVNVNEARVVATDVDKGEVIVSVGPVVSTTPEVSVTLTIWETLPVPSAAVTVMLLTPSDSGILDMTQFEPLIDDPPDAPRLLLQVTAGEPLPPVTVPESDVDREVVVAGGTLIVNASGLGA